MAVKLKRGLPQAERHPRLSRLAESEVYDLAEVSVMNAGQFLSQYRISGDSVHLLRADEQLNLALLASAELKDRSS